MSITPIDLDEIEAQIARLLATREAAKRFNATLSSDASSNGNLTRGQKIAASRAANKREQEVLAQAEFDRRSAAMKKAWKTRNKVK